MKLVFLIIASNDPVHLQDELTQRRTWAKSNAIESIWLRGGQTLHFDKNTQTLSVPIEESYNNILAKSLQGLKWCIEQKPFDFLIRANVSTYFEVTKILRILENYSPNEDFFGGYLDFVKRSTDSNHLRMFVNGGAIFLSNRTVMRLLQMNYSEWLNEPDDYAISQFLFSQRVKPIQIPRGNLSNTGILTRKAYYRVKSSRNPVMASLRMQLIFDLSEESELLKKFKLYKKHYQQELRFFQENFGSAHNYVVYIYSYLSASFRAKRVIRSHYFEK